MSKTQQNYDKWLSDEGPAALVLREPLMPVEGVDGVLFPSTFAASKDGSFKGGYNIDRFGDKNICLIDSVGSQANRIEPIFAEEKYADLVPQIIVEAGDHNISILEAGHRAGDALVRCSELQQELHDCFKAVQKNDCEPLAKIAPTSLVFGVWDSRDTQAKLPRLFTSTIRAYDVNVLTRSAQFVPATEYVDEGLLVEPKDKDKKTKDAYAERGFIHVPATASHGGVIANGGVRRDATLSLSALRQICISDEAEKTLTLQRYILGLAMVAFTYNPSGYLRAGCNLVINPDQPRELVEVFGDGRREPLTVSHDDAILFAQTAAKDFGVGGSKTVPFDKERAKEDVKAKS